MSMTTVALKIKIIIDLIDQINYQTHQNGRPKPLPNRWKLIRPDRASFRIIDLNLNLYYQYKDTNLDKLN
jgi:hypothetical protein